MVLETRHMKLLAIDTSTERMSLAVRNGDRVLAHEGLAGAQASAMLIDAVLALVAEANLTLSALDAIAFGRGPGAFTGLRTACAVAQGLALGLGRRLIPIDTLLCLAQAAPPSHPRVIGMLDARMGQVYAAAYERENDGWQTVSAPMLCAPQAWPWPKAWHGLPAVLAGNAMATYAAPLQALLAHCQNEPLHSWPDARAMLVLAANAWARGEAIEPQHAVPLYVRDDVARTTAERLADKASNA